MVLQAALLPLFLGAFGKCTHSLQALLQRHDALMSAALERLPAVTDSLATSVQLTSVAAGTDTCLLHCQAKLVKELQILVTNLEQPLGSECC